MADKRRPSNATTAEGGVTDTTPTTAEEAMDIAEAEDGFVDESAYAPTDH